MQDILSNPRFAFLEALLVLISGAVWVFLPGFGIWFTLIALLPWVLRSLVGMRPFQRTPLDWLMLLFLLSAWVGYWAAYDKVAAWIKVWLIFTAILLYYALSSQPRQNLNILSLLSFFLGILTSIYFFLTQPFSANPGLITDWWIRYRPQIGWAALHHGYISGLLVITTIFSVYWLWAAGRDSSRRFTVPLKISLFLGYGLILWAFILTMSRGVWAAMICGLGAWIIWRIIHSRVFVSRPGIRSFFPLFILAYLAAVLAIAYLGPAQAAEGSGQEKYGKNSRAELFVRGTYFIRDYPFTGGGLNSFPGLYSQYMLVIPSYFFANSYNMFLDVGIEQGIIGGFSFLVIYLGSIWLAARTIVNTQSDQIRLLSWLGLFALLFSFIHGFFYDYLYNGAITLLLFFPVGFSMIGTIDAAYERQEFALFPAGVQAFGRLYLPLFLVGVLGFTTLLILNRNRILSLWYSDLGAVKMSQAELRYFPTNEWATAELIPQLEIAEDLLRVSLRYNPSNETAHYRLGLISLLRQDYRTASNDFEVAHKQVPGHRGIIKNLGYAHVWLGNVDIAKVLLAQIPEAQDELNVYVWWWKDQNRSDLSANSSALITRLKYIQH